ncbi:MAG TPA: MGMT family protein [Capsulimonadaceae bacterium]|jgi:methylated-DNA-protein-cysteine methyltransferase-like protein
MSETETNPFEAIFDIVRAIPAGFVMSYGQVAADCRATARTVGWAMSQAPEGVPWHRVVGSDGYLRIGRRSPELQRIQRQLLEDEGVVVQENGCVEMERFRA